MSQVFNLADGHFALVAASGISGSGAADTLPLNFLTAPNVMTAGVLDYFEGLSVTSAQTIRTIMNRGVPSHHKRVDRQALRLSFSYLFTGGSGIPEGLHHAQFGAIADDLAGTVTQRQFTHFTHCILENQDIAEQPENNMVNVSMLALRMFHTASGLLYYR